WAHIRHLALRNQIAPTHLNSINSSLRCHRVHQPLAYKRRLVAPWRSIRCCGRLVGQSIMSGDAIRWHTVRPRQHASGPLCDSRPVRADVRALIVKKRIIDCKYSTVRVNRRADAMMLLARMIACDEILSAIFDPLYGSGKPKRGQTNQHIFRIDFATDTETATNMTLIQMYRRWSTVEQTRKHVAVCMRPLCSSV